MATNQLSSLLVQDRIVTPQQVEEAFQRQVLFGGRIGTNLLEIGALDERIFLVYLSRVTGLPWAGRDMLTAVDWEATELLDVETVRAEKILPVRFDGQTVRACECGVDLMRRPVGTLEPDQTRAVPSFASL